VNRGRSNCLCHSSVLWISPLAMGRNTFETCTTGHVLIGNEDSEIKFNRSAISARPTRASAPGSASWH
jgi:hypothetical protein